MMRGWWVGWVLLASAGCGAGDEDPQGPNGLFGDSEDPGDTADSCPVVRAERVDPSVDRACITNDGTQVWAFWDNCLSSSCTEDWRGTCSLTLEDGVLTVSGEGRWVEVIRTCYPYCSDDCWSVDARCDLPDGVTGDTRLVWEGLDTPVRVREATCIPRLEDEPDPWDTD